MLTANHPLQPSRRSLTPSQTKKLKAFLDMKLQLGKLACTKRERSVTPPLVTPSLAVEVPVTSSDGLSIVRAWLKRKVKQGPHFNTLFRYCTTLAFSAVPQRQVRHILIWIFRALGVIPFDVTIHHELATELIPTRHTLSRWTGNPITVPLPSPQFIYP